MSPFLDKTALPRLAVPSYALPAYQVPGAASVSPVIPIDSGTSRRRPTYWIEERPVSARGRSLPGSLQLLAQPLRGLATAAPEERISEGRIRPGRIRLAANSLLCEAFVSATGNLLESVLDGYQDRQRYYRRLALFEELTRRHRGRPVPVEELLGVE